MEAYFKAHEYYIKHLWFRYEKTVYEGTGVLTWNPDKGFHIVARIEGHNIPEKKEFRSIEFHQPIRIRMELEPKIVAITPLLEFSDLGLYWGRLLKQVFSVDIGRLLLIDELNLSGQSAQDCWYGSAIYEVGFQLLLPDTIYQETTVGQEVREAYSKATLDYNGIGGEEILGELKDDKFVYFNWAFPKSSWTKNQAWQFAEGLRYALSMLSGRVIQLRYHEAQRNRRVAKEFHSNGRSTSIGLVLRLFDKDIIDKNLLIQLAYFLAQENEPAKICKRIFHQIEAASNQESKQGVELLLSTTLEAALRSIYHFPFHPKTTSKSNRFNLSDTLKRFGSEYLAANSSDNKEWKKITEMVMQAYSRLRHRNAHPDWLTGGGGMLSENELEQSTNDTILLSRFYGYMVLALAGVENLTPKFPAPVSTWKPYMTFNKTMK